MFLFLKDHTSYHVLHVPSSEPTNPLRPWCIEDSTHGARRRLKRLRKYTSQIQVLTIKIHKVLYQGYRLSKQLPRD